MVIVAQSKDRNWYKAKRYDGLEGMIPYNYIARRPAYEPAKELAMKSVRIQYMPYVTYILQMTNIVVTLSTILQ